MGYENLLRKILTRIDCKGYKAYKEIRGEYGFTGYTLFIDHPQGDPFALPSRIRVRVKRRSSRFPEDTTSSPSRKIALEDYLTRSFLKSSLKHARQKRGSGKSGLIMMEPPAQEILQRSSVEVNSNFVEARFFMGLPADKRRISGRDAIAMFFEELPVIVKSSLFFKSHDPDSLYRHIKTAEDADFIRTRLKDMNLVSFIANGSSLPRASGIDPEPLISDSNVMFRSPEKFEVTLNLPNYGKISGMGIPRGITLIVGGGYHGKSTFLNAIELGVYNHIPGDGREFAVTVYDAVKIRACDGRSIEKTDISPFINNLPFQKKTSCFSTANASGSTSQAAAISEAIEAGTSVLLLDEDTSATNFMIRDARMQKLVARDKEPITPFIDKAEQLYKDQGVSAVIVMGGAGDYFSIADQVIQMTEYTPSDVTEKAKKIAGDFDPGRVCEGGDSFDSIRQRIPLAESFNPFREGRLKIAPEGVRGFLFGNLSTDISDIEQIVEVAQVRAIAWAVNRAVRYMDGSLTLREVLNLVIKEMDEGGLDIFPPHITGDLSRFRPVDLAGAINRMRTLKVRQQNSP